MLKHTMEEKDLLTDFMHSHASRIVFNELDDCAQGFEQNLLQLSLDAPDSRNRLVILKARVEGARQMAAAMKTRLNLYRTKK